MMVRRILATLCLAAAAFANTPRPLDDATLPTPEGPVRLSQYRGKVVVFAIILTNCSHCAQSMELMSRLQKEYGPRGFQMLAAAGDNNAAAKIGPFKKIHQLTFPLGYMDEATAERVGDFTRADRLVAPIYLFVDRKGVVRFQFSMKDDNFFKNEEKNVRTIIEGLLK
jgi:peroxiredoxin